MSKVSVVDAVGGVLQVIRGGQSFDGDPSRGVVLVYDGQPSPVSGLQHPIPSGTLVGVVRLSDPVVAVVQTAD